MTTTLYVRNGAEFREATREEFLAHSTGIDSPQSFHLRHLLVGTHGDLRIGGRWFELAGFSVGACVSVRVCPKQLIIDVVQEPPRCLHVNTIGLRGRRPCSNYSEPTAIVWSQWVHVPPNGIRTGRKASIR